MILKANLSTDVLTHVKDLKLGELAIILSGSMLNHVVLRCEIGLISLTDPNVCFHKSMVENTIANMQCRILREDESVTLINKEKRIIPVDKADSYTAKPRKPGRKGPTIGDLAKARELFKDGLSYQQIGEHFGLNASTVCRWLTNYKYKMSPNS